MKSLLFLLSVLSIFSTTAAEMTESTRENIIHIYKENQVLFYDEAQAEASHQRINSIRSEFSFTKFRNNFETLKIFNSLRNHQERIHSMKSLIYGCINESHNEEIYEICTHSAVTESISQFVSSAYGQNDILDVMVEDFLEIQMAILNLNPIKDSSSVNSKSRRFRKVIDKNNSYKRSSQKNTIQK